jgi:hypothetical protein
MLPLEGPRPARPGGWVRLARLLALGLALLLPSCEWDGNFTVLGYTTQPNYDLGIRTVRVKMFKNRTFWTTTPVPGLEMELTKAVVREIEQKTPYKVVQDNPDTEITGTIVALTKNPLSYNQLNYARELETTMVVELTWRDLRTGQVLTKPPRRFGHPLPPETPVPLAPESAPGLLRTAPIPGTPGLPPEAVAATLPEPPPPPPGAPCPPVPPVVVRSVGHFIPELGQSMTTAMQENVNRMAEQIVSEMEKPW